MLHHDAENELIQEQINRTFTNRSQNEGVPRDQRLAISFLKVHPSDDSKFVFKVMPGDRQIIRSLADLYWLRASLCLEFPFYYVG